MISTEADLLSLLGNITTILSVFLTAIAAISLVVGGIGIMNIMLVSVVERTREIGLRKAVGASNNDILAQFLWESVMLTFFGGAAGIALGAGMSFLAYLAVNRFGGIVWTFSLPLNAVLLAVAVSSFIGLVFGIYPARQAARKNPIDALRYE
jgi:putative ABC transport system permease protein